MAHGFRRAVAIAILVLMVPGPAVTQGTTAIEEPEGGFRPRPQVEEMVIIGESLDQQYMQEAASITSFSAADLKALRVQNISDLADFTPNLEINTRSAASNPTLFIRGIGLKDYNANAASAVAIYQDGVPINAPAIQLGQLFDIQSIDVRRGPQGDVDGRNATAGAILVHSVLPGDEFAATGSFSYGNYDSISLEGAINVPLIEGVLASRTAFTFNLRDGYIENACADWNPQAYPEFADTAPDANGLVDSFLVTPETLMREYELDKAAGNSQTLNPARYTISTTTRANRQTVVDNAGIDAQARRLQPDSVCIIQGPGYIATRDLFDNGVLVPEGTFKAASNPQLADFQDIDHWVNDVDNWAGRSLLLYRPLDSLELLLNVHGSQSSGDTSRLSQLGAEPKVEELGFFESLTANWSEAAASRILGLEGRRKINGLDATPTFPGEGGSDPYLGYYNAGGPELLDSWGTSLTGTWTGDHHTLISVSGYEWYDRNITDEADAHPLRLFPAEYSDNAWQATQELRLVVDTQAIEWTLGGLFLYEKLDARNLYPDTRNFEIDQRFNQKLISLGPYAHARYEIRDDLMLDAGIRYNYEQKEFFLESNARSTVSTGVGQEIPPQTEKATWTAPTGDLTLTYTPLWGWLDTASVDLLNFYGTYARGFKGGHFNASLSIRSSEVLTDIEPVEPEHIHSFEIGSKIGLFDNAVRLRVAAFRYWYKDLQIFDVGNEADSQPIPELLNVPRARVWGAELEGTIQPIEGLTIDGAFSWLDSRVQEFEITKAVRLGPRGVPEVETFDYAGNRLIAAPRYSVSVRGSYEIPLSGWGHLIPQYDFNWRSKQYLDPQQIDPISQEAYAIHNARLAYRTEDERIELAFWIENIFDKHYKDDVFDLSRSFNTILEVYGEPRMYGGTISYSW